MVWSLAGGSNGAKVRYFSPTFRELQLNRAVSQVLLTKYEPHISWRIWKLLPVNVEGTVTPSQSLSDTLGSDSLPSYDRSTIGQSSTHTQHAESGHDELGTMVNEVTVVTTTSTVTTRKRYRVEDI
jgi:hypothetical protein